MRSTRPFSAEGYSEMSTENLMSTEIPGYSEIIQAPVLIYNIFSSQNPQFPYTLRTSQIRERAEGTGSPQAACPHPPGPSRPSDPASGLKTPCFRSISLSRECRKSKWPSLEFSTIRWIRRITRSGAPESNGEWSGIPSYCEFVWI